MYFGDYKCRIKQTNKQASGGWLEYECGRQGLIANQIKIEFKCQKPEPFKNVEVFGKYVDYSYEPIRLPTKREFQPKFVSAVTSNVITKNMQFATCHEMV